VSLVAYQDRWACSHRLSYSIFVALALRYDYSRALKANPPPRPSSNFARPYFYTVFIAYIIGELGLTPLRELH
jgi:hypothetical protein